MRKIATGRSARVLLVAAGLVLLAGCAYGDAPQTRSKPTGGADAATATADTTDDAGQTRDRPTGGS